MNQMRIIYDALVNAWDRTPIAEQRPIDLALNQVINELDKKTDEVMALEREFNRFDTFKHDQEKLDNILSLLKICERLNVEYDKDIDLNECNIEDMQKTINSFIMQKIIAKRQFKEAERDLKTLWNAVNHNEYKMSGEYVFPNSDLSVEDIRKVIPYFDINMD